MLSLSRARQNEVPSAVKWCGDFADLERGLRKTDAVSAKVWVTHAHSVYLQFLPRTRPRSKTGTHALLSIKRPHLPSAMSHNSLHASSPELASTITPHETVTPVQEKQEKHTGKAGASWQANEQQVLPHNRFWIVFPGLMCCVFLAALDQVRSQLRLFPADRRFTHRNRPSLRLLYQPLSNVSARAKITAGLEGIPSFFLLARFDSNPFSQLLPPCG